MAVIRPKLKPFQIHLEGKKFILEQLGTNRNIILDSEIRPLFDLLDGKSTVQQIVGRLRAEGVKISFHSTFKTIELLSQNDFIEKDLVATEVEVKEEDWISRIHKKLDSINYFKTILGRVGFSHWSNSVGLVLFLFFFFVILFGFMTSIYPPGRLTEFYSFPAGFGSFNQSYAQGFALVYLCACGLMTVKGVLRFFLQLLAQGRVFSIGIRFFRGLVSFGPSDAAIYLSVGKWVPLLFHLASVIQFIAVTSVVGLIFKNPSGFECLKLAAFLLTLLELNPYLQSDFRKVLGLMPLRWIFPYALPWAAGSFYFCFLILKQNVADFLVLGFAGYFALEILATLVLYLYIPVRAPIAQWRAQRRIRETIFKDQNSLKPILTSNPLFMGLPQEMLDELVTGGKLKNYAKGSLLISQGDKNSDLYVVVQGTISVIKRDNKELSTELARLGPGATVGELSVIHEHFATADVRAEKDVVALVISKKLLQRTERDAQDYEIIVERIMLGQFFGASPFFRTLPREVVRIFTNEGKFETIAADVHIVEQDSNTKSFYLLIRGAVVVLIGGKKVAELNQGDFFGEVSAINDEPQMATVRSLGECVLLRLDPESFWAIMSRNIQFSLFIESAANQRQAEYQRFQGSKA